MNLARFVIGIIVVSALIAGAALYYLQVYAYYEEISLEVEDVQLTSMFTGEPEPILFENFKAIDSDSSPLRFRLNAPGWFDCFDAGQIGADLASGVALPFMGIENIQYGIDRVIAVYPDGRAFAWHQINDCGEVVFDGNRAPDTCPPAPERLQ